MLLFCVGVLGVSGYWWLWYCSFLLMICRVFVVVVFFSVLLSIGMISLLLFVF